MAEPPFDIARFAAHMSAHARLLDLGYRAHGDDWVELALPPSPAQAIDGAAGVRAVSPVLALLDVATAMAIWTRIGRFRAQATLDLRVDQLRPIRTDVTVIGRGSCYRVTPSVAFVRGEAHEGDPADPVVSATGTYMFIDAAS